MSPRDYAQPRLPPREPTPAAEIAVELRNADIKRRNALITEAKLERRRRGKKKRASRASRASWRIGNLTRLFFTRYRGTMLPDDDSGRQDAWIMINHIAMLSSPKLRIEDWLRRCAPWLRDEAMIERAIAKPMKWKADTMAKILNLTDEERTRLKTWTIGAVDCTKEQREARRREKARLRMITKRQEAGAKPREQSLTRTEPWKLDGISRRQWERRQRMSQVRAQPDAPSDAMSQMRAQHTTCSTANEFASSVPAAPPSDAGSPAGYVMAVGLAPPRTAASLAASGCVAVGLASRPATTSGCTRIPVSNLAEAEAVRSAILAERGREVARLARRRGIE